MATILLSLSSKEDKITHRSEVLLRFLPFHGVNLRSKTGIFIYPRHFRYFVNRTASQKAGVVIPENITSITQQEAEKRGYSIKDLWRDCHFRQNCHTWSWIWQATKENHRTTSKCNNWGLWYRFKGRYWRDVVGQNNQSILSPDQTV